MSFNYKQKTKELNKVIWEMRELYPEGRELNRHIERVEGAIWFGNWKHSNTFDGFLNKIEHGRF